MDERYGNVPPYWCLCYLDISGQGRRGQANGLKEVSAARIFSVNGSTLPYLLWGEESFMPSEAKRIKTQPLVLTESFLPILPTRPSVSE